ncbi:MAG: MYXO-CTERM sorting domain-containing protein [Polyangiaceae bacterium]
MRQIQGRPVRSVSPTVRCAHLGLAVALANVGFAQLADAKEFMEYLKPTPITCSPLSSASWGVAGVLPRDLCNGIESAKGAGIPPDYYYWDGQIIAGKDGSFHMFMSTWPGSAGFNPGWTNSESYHAVSEGGILGPYRRKGYIWSSGSHKGHNTTALELPDGSYAVVVSEVVPFTIYKSSSLDGPWTSCTPSIQANGINYTDGRFASNVSLVARHDGKFEIVQRHGHIGISDTLCGTYKLQKPTWTYPAANRPTIDSIYPRRTSIPGVTNPSYAWEEDPHIWYSGGVYHVLYSGSGDRIGWHVYSTDGLTDWKDNGLAFGPRSYQKIFCYEGSTTCNQWYKMERPGVVLQKGLVTHITWSVADVDKDNQIPANSNHGSKIIVVPFDGASFAADFGGGGRGGAGSGGTGSGGASSTGGTKATGGTSNAGGASASGGRPSAGGSQSTAGSSAAETGGNATTGGASSASSGRGGNGSGGQPTGTSIGGGAPTAGGLTGNAGAGGSTESSDTATSDGDATDSSGCGCRVSNGQGSSRAVALFGLLGLLMLRSRKRQIAD